MDAPRALRLSVLLEQVDDTVLAGAATPPLTIGDVVRRTAHAGFGFLVAFLALISIPFYALSLPFGLAIAALGAQLLAGRSQPWLPAFLMRRVLPARARGWLGEKLARFAVRLEHIVKPRLRFAVRGRLIGLGLIAQGLGLALPLPIPGSNWLFLAPALFFAVGLLEDDGLWVLIAHAATVVQITLGLLFAHALGAAVARALAWLA